MVLESTVLCIDNSEWMRNGDFLPTRIQAQQDAVNIICHAKTRQNPENNVGLLTLASLEVLVTLTSDIGKILTRLHNVKPTGNLRLLAGIRIAHLALKHRQGKNHKMRIVAFVGSPLEYTEQEVVKLGKKLKKEKVNVDVVCLGDNSETIQLLTTFVNTLNGKEGTGSHLVTVPPGPSLSDALKSSPVVQGEDGYTGGQGFDGGFDFGGDDPNLDPELALALRVSMEEQRQRQSEDTKPETDSAVSSTDTPMEAEPSTEDELLQRALNMSTGTVDFASLSEDEQIAMAIQMSIQNDSRSTTEQSTTSDATSMEVDEEPSDKATTATSSTTTTTNEGAAQEDKDDYSAVMNDPEFLQHLVSSLPGVDPNSEAVRNAVGALIQEENKTDNDKDGKEKEKK